MHVKVSTGALFNESIYSLLNSFIHGVQICDCEGTIVFSNHAHHRILGYQDGELMGKKIWNLQPTDAEAMELQRFFFHVISGQPAPERFMTTNRKTDGSLVSLQIDWNYIRSDDDEIIGFVSEIADVTQSLQKQRVQEQSIEGMTTLLRVSENLAEILDLQKVLQQTVDGVSQLFGLGTAAIYLLDGDMVRLSATYPPLPPDFPEPFRMAPLTDHPHLASSISLKQPLLLPNVWEEELSEAERAINAQRNLFTLLFVPLISDEEVLGAFIVGSVGAPVAISPFEIDLACTLGNLAALAVKNARLFEGGVEYARQLEQSIAERRSAEAEREKLRDELFQAQKLEAIGQLAGGVAHDFNNQLSGIMGYADLLQLKVKEEQLQQYVKNILKLAERSASLTRQLLAFSRKGTFQSDIVNIHEIIHEVMDMLRHTISKKIRIMSELNADIAHTLGDISQIQNALLNLALNARDAMLHGGELRFVTSTVDVKENSVLFETFGLSSGRYIRVAVIDSGSGIPSDVLTHVFEPFYTTKKRGEGTGMGLAAVYGTMKTHRGAVEVESEPGVGTTFFLYFPEHEYVDAAAEATVEIVNPTDGKCILVVDDEELIVQALVDQLEHAGYSVRGFTDSEKALAYFKKEYTSVSLIITDIMMPRMTGTELYHVVKSISANVRVMLSSGYSTNGEVQDILQDETTVFIQKPFRSDELIRSVTQILQK